MREKINDKPAVNYYCIFLSVLTRQPQTQYMAPSA